VDELSGHSIRFHRFPLAGVEPMSAATARSYPRHTHDQFGIGVIDAGGHASWSGRGQVEAGPRHFICVNPGEVHDGHAIRQQPRTWRILYFDPSLMEETRADVLDGAPPAFTFAEPVFADPSLLQFFEHAFSHATNADVDDRMACETSILQLVAHLGRHSTSPTPHTKRLTACIRRARERIDDDPTARMMLTDLARDACLSRYQLIRGFARELGLTPHAYLLQRRITLARRLIRAGRALADVAAAAGFCDQSHLTRCFVRHLGITPRRYAARSG
jgi:AraC-like DNA-binding protein